MNKFSSIKIESNDVIKDFQIMKNANILICSCSTLSWCASLFSNNLQKLYIPNYNNNRIYETFLKPIENIEKYNIKLLNTQELEFLLSK